MFNYKLTLRTLNPKKNTLILPSKAFEKDGEPEIVTLNVRSLFYKVDMEKNILIGNRCAYDVIVGYANFYFNGKESDSKLKDLIFHTDVTEKLLEVKEFPEVLLKLTVPVEMRLLMEFLFFMGFYDKDMLGSQEEINLIEFHSLDFFNERFS